MGDASKPGSVSCRHLSKLPTRWHRAGNPYPFLVGIASLFGIAARGVCPVIASQPSRPLSRGFSPLPPRRGQVIFCGTAPYPSGSPKGSPCYQGHGTLHCPDFPPQDSVFLRRRLRTPQINYTIFLLIWFQQSVQPLRRRNIILFVRSRGYRTRE